MAGGLETLKAKLQRARETEERLAQELKRKTRQTETQLLCTLGRAVLHFGTVDPEFCHDFSGKLDGYLSRPGDRDLVRESIFMISENLEILPLTDEAPRVENRGVPILPSDHKPWE